MNIAGFLKRVPPFDSLSTETLEALSQHARVVHFERDAHVVQTGEPGDAMYVIAEGKVLVKLVEIDRERHITWLGPEELFGEMALLTGEARTADVVAEEPTTCVAIDRAPFYALLEHNLEVAAFLTEMVGARLLDGGQIAQVGKYRVLHEIGRGGMGTVFAGYHPQLHRPVALKMLNHAMVFDDEFAERFATEAAIIAGLDHPNIVKVYDHESAYATQFIVMELLHGETLGDVIERETRLPEARVRRILLQLARALGHAHERGITHRDIKPDNVMLTPDGPLKLMDFGISGTLGADDDENWEPIGTPIYMSPEQMHGRDIDERTDIYALGVMAYAMLTGEALFYHEDVDELIRLKESAPLPSPRVRCRDISDEMIEFILCACAGDPAHRYTSCDEVIEHFGGEPNKAGLRARHITILYPSDVELPVDAAVARLSAELEKQPVTISEARLDDLGAIEK